MAGFAGSSPLSRVTQLGHGIDIAFARTVKRNPSTSRLALLAFAAYHALHDRASAIRWYGALNDGSQLAAILAADVVGYSALS